MPPLDESSPPSLLIEDQPMAPRAGTDMPAAVRNVLVAAGSAPDAPGAVGFVVIHSEHPATKTYSLDPTTSAPLKVREPFLSKGTVYRARLPGDAPLAMLAQVLEALPPNAVLVCGTLADPRNEAPLTTKRRLTRTPDAIARTKGFAVYLLRQRGLVMLDHDAKDLGDALKARLAAAGGLVAVLAQVCPETAQAGLLIRPSVSTGIRATTGGNMTPGGGCHWYFVAEDGADIPAFIERLHQRLVLAGWGWVFINKAGRCQVRSLFDTAASGDPERLVFEANAILIDGLEHIDGARAATIERDGVPLRTTMLLELTTAERARLTKIEEELLAAAEPDAKPFRDKAKQDRRGALVARGMTPDKAQERVAWAFDQGRLDTTERVRLDNGDRPTVADILRNPHDYDGAKGADPLEPDYGGGHNKAIWRVHGFTVWCDSRAHGGQKFTLGWSARDMIEAWEARHDPDELSTMYRWTPRNGLDADRAQLDAAKVPSWAAVEFGLADLEDLPSMVGRGDWRELRSLKADLPDAFNAALDKAAASGLVDGAAVETGIAAAAQSAPGVIPAGWQGRLTRGKAGQVFATITNALVGLGQGCRLDKHLRQDQATGMLVLADVPPGSEVWNALGLEGARPLYLDPRTGHPVFAWSDTLLTTALAHLESCGAGLPDRGQAGHAVRKIAEDGAYSSVGQWLRGTVWDRKPRLDGWLTRHAGAADTKLNHVALSLWMTGGAARALFPEERGEPAQMDTALVLVGEQGAGKSQFFRALCPVSLWHTESALGSLSNKDAPMQLASRWIVDMAEGSTVKANTVETFKQFLTARTDSFRPPYKEYVVQVPRRSVFAMTVNPDGAGFLRDGTGNRRFWIVEVGQIDTRQLDRDRDQLWAEAVSRFDAGEHWWLEDPALIAEAAAAAEGHRVQTSIEVLLRRYVDEAPPLDPHSTASWATRRAPLTVMGAAPDVLREVGQDKALGAPFGTADYARAMTSMGWVRERVVLRNAPVERYQTIWVNREGRRALDDTKRQPGAFRAWLETEARAGRIGLRPGAGLNEAWFQTTGVLLPGADPASHPSSPF